MSLHPSDPTSEHEWTIHAINIHGVFFQRWCEKVIAGTKAWKVKSTEYPVEFPPPSGPWRGKESALDIRAELRREERVLTLLFECKKNNPEFVNWIFFPKDSGDTAGALAVSYIENVRRPAPAAGWDVIHRSQPLGSNFIVADEARETRASYLQYRKGDKTKTSNAAISDAAYQITLATQAITREEVEFSQTLGSANAGQPLHWERHVIIPTIVTSAHLFTCSFDPLEVVPQTGELPYDRAVLQEHPFLFFKYPMPRHLQFRAQDPLAMLIGGGQEQLVRKHILVVHSENLNELLDLFETHADAFFGVPTAAG